MKTLLLLRHAKSSWAEEGVADHDRPLNDRGKRDAPRVGELLNHLGLAPTLVLSSTAKRARKTASRVQETATASFELSLIPQLYLASPHTILEAVRQFGAHHDVVMVVGHNPGLEDLVCQLCGAADHLPTAALARLDLDIANWSELTGSSPANLAGVWRPEPRD